MTVKTNNAAIAKMLKSPEVRKMLRDKANQIAAETRQDPSIVRHEAEVRVEDFETDRAVVQVTIDHPGGIGIEAKHGPLTKATHNAITD